MQVKQQYNKTIFRKFNKGARIPIICAAKEMNVSKRLKQMVFALSRLSTKVASIQSFILANF